MKDIRIFLKRCAICLAILLPFYTSSVFATIYDVRIFGAIGDGTKLDSPAINKAITECAAAGGGTVTVPAGTYLCGSVHLKSNVHISLDAGAVIVGAPQELKAYDPPEVFEGKAYQDGGHTYFRNSLIWGENLENVSITGFGTINGGGLTKQDKEVGEGSIGLGDKSIALKNCRKIVVRDITIFHGGHFALILTGCKNITLDNLTIDSNRDGINLDCCQNATVSNCKINTPDDDGLCLKSSYALGRKVITENIAITNCQVSGYTEGSLLDGTMKPAKNGTGRIKFGTESNGGLRNVTIANCIFRNCRGLAIEEVDGGIVENISISNLSMMEIVHYPIYITLGNRNRCPDSTAVGVMKNISITDLIATVADSMSGIQITGMPGLNIENVTLQNIRISYKGGGTIKQSERIFPELDKGYIDPKGIYRYYPEPLRLGITPSYGLFARHIIDLELKDVSLEFVKEDQRPAVILDDVDGVSIHSLNIRVSDKAPSAISVAKGKNIRIDNAKTDGAAKTVLCVTDTVSGNIILSESDIRSYVQPVLEKSNGQVTLFKNLGK